MGKLVALLSLITLLLSCKKEEPATAPFSEASYKLTFTGLWTSPKFTVPAGAHFTAITGAVHNGNTSLWKEGSLASPGLRFVAEIGYQPVLVTEVDSLIAAKVAIAAINMPPPPPASSISRAVYCNSNYPRLSFASMIAPSPDWFIGVSNLTLYRNNAWVTDTTVQLHVYDAGTEEGDVLGQNNPATVPQGRVLLLTPATATALANGNATLAPIAQVRLTKQ